MNKPKFERNGSAVYYHMTCIGKAKTYKLKRLKGWESMGEVGLNGICKRCAVLMNHNNDKTTDSGCKLLSVPFSYLEKLIFFVTQSSFADFNVFI